ncbi:MAG: sulfotransferase [Rhodobacter sp.]|nr:sulfotransferase [Rhodobacter sp.]
MKTFVLGVGAQKSGTTWLRDYLAKQPNADFGALQEYHIWDIATLPPPNIHADRLLAKVRTQIDGGLPAIKDSRALMRLNFIANPESYFDYFTTLLGKPGIDLTGDITPSYSRLPSEVLRRIFDGFAARAVQVRPIFLMRDPVYRLRSAVRMRLRKTDMPASPDAELDMMNELHLGRLDLARSNYHDTVMALDAAFGPKQVFYAFYEEFFAESSIQRLRRFLNLDLSPPELDVRKNASKPIAELSEPDYTRLASGYGGIHAFCAKRFDVDISGIWHYRG